MNMLGITGFAVSEFSPVHFYWLFFGSFLASIFVLFVLWIYASLAYYKISIKLNQANPGIAFIPFVGPLIVAFKSSKIHWWPWFLIAGFFLGSFELSLIFFTVFFVFVTIWHWKMFENLNRPSWWSLFLLVPFITPYLFWVRGFYIRDVIPVAGIVIYCVLIGICAWSLGKKKVKATKGIIISKAPRKK